MAIEIERKFIVAAAPPPDELGAGVEIRQGYLAEEDDVEVRVRIAAADATLAVKAGRGMARTEVEVTLSTEQAEALWPHTLGRRIDKVRHRVAIDDSVGLAAEVDIYAGPLVGLCVVEVEFEDEAAAAAFIPPPWFGRELTGQPGWSNAALARHGRPGSV